jgi:uncharacterized integral membrane protein
VTPKLLLTLTLVVLAVVFVLQNTTVVEVRFLFWTLSMSRALLIVLLLATGVLIGWLAHSLRFLRRKR